MDVVWPRCVGLDIGKKFLVARALVSTGDGPPHKELRTLGTMTRDPLALQDWIVENGCVAVAMESTGPARPYRKPIWNVLEDVDGIALVLTNPQHMKAVPGRKTDVKDAAWIADYYEQRDHTSLQRRAVEQLERLRYKVTLQPPTAA